MVNKRAVRERMRRAGAALDASSCVGLRRNLIENVVAAMERDSWTLAQRTLLRAGIRVQSDWSRYCSKSRDMTAVWPRCMLEHPDSG